MAVVLVGAEQNVTTQSFGFVVEMLPVLCDVALEFEPELWPSCCAVGISIAVKDTAAPGLTVIVSAPDEARDGTQVRQ
jgi:hypothetical protein